MAASTTPGPRVGVGPTSIAGYGATLLGLIVTALAVLFPDVPQQDLAVIASAVFTVVSFAVTQIGRYMQAHAIAKQPPVKPAITTAAASAPVSATPAGEELAGDPLHPFAHGLKVTDPKAIPKDKGDGDAQRRSKS